MYLSLCLEDIFKKTCNKRWTKMQAKYNKYTNQKKKGNHGRYDENRQHRPS